MIPARAIHQVTRHFYDFAVADHPRYQLMNERVIPGFEPSPAAFAPSLRVFERGRRDALALGGISEDQFVIWVSLLGGLVNQHFANDPDGTRFSDLLPVPSTSGPTPSASSRSARSPSPEATMSNEHSDDRDHPSPHSKGLVQPRIPRPTAMRLATTEYERTAAALAALSADDWTRPTVCTDWDVRQMACHTIGMAKMVTTPWETARQQRAAAKAADGRRHRRPHCADGAAGQRAGGLDAGAGRRGCAQHRPARCPRSQAHARAHPEPSARGRPVRQRS